MSVEAIDRLMMSHCIGLSKASGKAGQYPYAAVICRDGMIVAEPINRVTHDGDVTRHAEVAAISQAQKMFGTVSLEDCEIYMNAEPCAFCCYAIRETRIRRVVFGLSSPHMGGVSKWNILGDMDICSAMPSGVPIENAAILGAQMRFRAVMMTSIAFILGLLPLVIAIGAAEISRRAVGTAVFGGMLAASSIGIFLVPALYVTFQRLHERAKTRFEGSGKKQHPLASPTTTSA